MNLSYTQHTLDKLESLFKILGYKLRYEKGNFKTGTCLLEKNRVIIVNRFSNLESKIIALAELIRGIEADESLFDERQKAFFYLLKQTNLEF